MTEKKLHTIYELVKGKKPGEIKLSMPYGRGGWFRPFFLSRGGTWYGLDDLSGMDRWNEYDAIWSLYTEPKPKKVLYQWAKKYMNKDLWYCDGDFHSDEEVALKYLGTKAEIKRLDWTRIEVEDDAD